MAIESIPKKKPSGPSSLLAPGFRFHPTDEELVRYYLRRKVCGKAFRLDAISEIDIYKIEPWDLPSFSKLKSRDLEWYFFSMLDKKYGNGSKTNRATEKGYWKTTGKDRAVYHRTQIVGMKKTLVYHIGRAPKGQRSNWVMHEYRLTDLDLERAGIGQDAFVLCRVFQKSGSGPKNGERYGAPFVDEEWEEDELELVEVDFGDDAYLDGDDLEQILGSDDPSDPAQSNPAPLLLTFHSADGSYGEQTAESFNDTQNHFAYDENLYDLALPALYELDTRPVKHEYIGESSKSDDLDFLLHEPLLDSSDNLKCNSEGGFIEANDFANPNETNNTSAFDMLDDEYLTFFDTKDDTLLELPYDPEVMLGNEDLVSDHVLLHEKELDDGPKQSMLANELHVDDNNNDDDALPSDKQDSAKYESDYDYPFIKHASHMLGSLPAPPAEYPSKELSIRHNSLSQPSSSVHVTAGMIQIHNLTDERNEFLSKHDNVNLVLSFGLLQNEDGSTSLESSVSILRGKNVSTLTRGWFYFICLWVLILSISFKIGTIVRAN